MHLKNPPAYENLRKFMSSLLPNQSITDESSIKDSLSWFLVAHRKCTGGNSICNHL